MKVFASVLVIGCVFLGSGCELHVPLESSSEHLVVPPIHSEAHVAPDAAADLARLDAHVNLEENPITTESIPRDEGATESEIVTTENTEEPSEDDDIVYSEDGNMIARGSTYKHGNERSFHLNRPVGRGWANLPLATGSCSSLDAAAFFLATELDNVKGVERIEFKAHEVSIELGKLYDWEDLEAVVVPVLASSFDEELVNQKWHDYQLLGDKITAKHDVVSFGENAKIVIMRSERNAMRRDFHFNRVIMRECINTADFPLPSTDAFSRPFNDLNAFERFVVTELNEIEGVEQVWFKSYFLSIDLGEAYEWEALRPTIIEILKKAYEIEIEEPAEEQPIDDVRADIRNT